MRQHGLDGLAAGLRTEEIVVVGAAGREQVSQRIAVAGRRGGGEAFHQLAEFHGASSLLRLQPQ